MPSASHGMSTKKRKRDFTHISPGCPTPSLQTVSTFVYRHKRYVAYISGRSQLNILSSPTALIQAIPFQQDLVAVAAEPDTGRLAVAARGSGSGLVLLAPVTEGWETIWWEKTLVLREDGEDNDRDGKSNNASQVLSWGTDGELLVGGQKQLSLFSTLPSSRSHSPGTSILDGGVSVEVRMATWNKPAASPVAHASFSPSASLIATAGARDRLVKIWRRLSYEEATFDYTYLPHPALVTHLEWRPPEEQYEERRGSGISGRHEDQPEVLYTFAADGLLRVWRTGGMHELRMMTLYTTVDLVSAIPASPSLTVKDASSSHGNADAAATSSHASKPLRYAFIIPSDNFCKAVTSSIGLNLEGKLSYAHEHLKEISSHYPDIAVALDGSGRMSAWGLSNIGHKRRPETPNTAAAAAATSRSSSSTPPPPQPPPLTTTATPYHVAHAEQFPLRLPTGTNARFTSWFDDSELQVLVHDFGGEVQWWRGSVESFFSPSSAPEERIERVAAWNGQTSPIGGLHSSGDSMLLSWSRDVNDAAIWQRSHSASSLMPRPLTAGDGIVDAISLAAGQFTVFLRSHPSRLLLRNSRGEEIAQASLERFGICKLFAEQALQESLEDEVSFVLLSGSGKGAVYRFASIDPSLKDCREFDSPPTDQDEPTTLASLVLNPEYTDRFGIVRVTRSGRLLLDHVSDGSEVMQVAVFESGVEQPSSLAVNNDFAVIASEQGRQFAIVNLRDGYVEHRSQSSARPVRHIEFLPGHNVVVVGYDVDVEVFAPRRYTHAESFSWSLLNDYTIAGSGLTVSALAWLSDGTLAIAAGNGVFFSSTMASSGEFAVGISEGSALDMSVTDLCAHLQNPLPVWHPILLAETFTKGDSKLVIGILRRLLEKMTFWTEGDALHPLLNVPAEQLFGAEEMHKDAKLDEDTIARLRNLLEEQKLPGLSHSEQRQLGHVLETIVYCSEHLGGLDNPALRYLFEWKLQTLKELDSHADEGRPNGILAHDSAAPTLTAPAMSWREIAFAYHSATQQPLLDILVAHYDNKITWSIAKQLGITAWLNSEALAQIFESLAQTAYRSIQPPDPTNATLFFLALHKKPTLLALWRIATWHKEQRTTMKFLQRDFSQPEHRTAAKKNAYALLGKRRFDYAAAFFLLADDPASATSVLAGQCGDVMLAIAVARLYSGDGSDMLHKLVNDRIIPDAQRDCDRWRLSWCHSILAQRHQAADALVKPFDGVMRSWQQDDPVTLALYSKLRQVESEYEWEAVLRASRIYRRKGLWLSALALMRNWDFPPLAQRQHSKMLQATNETQQPASLSNGVRGEAPSMLGNFAQPSMTSTANGEPPSMLDGFSSMSLQSKEPPSMLDGFTSAPAATADEKSSREAKAAELLAKLKAKKPSPEQANKKDKDARPKREPTQFKEPDANSLLDSFGF